MRRHLEEDVLPQRAFETAPRSAWLPNSIAGLVPAAKRATPRPSTLILLLQATEALLVWLSAATPLWLSRPAEGLSSLTITAVAGLLALTMVLAFRSLDLYAPGRI